MKELLRAILLMIIGAGLGYGWCLMTRPETAPKPKVVFIERLPTRIEPLTIAAWEKAEQERHTESAEVYF